jgi:hypothetical protein
MSGQGASERGKAHTTNTRVSTNVEQLNNTHTVSHHCTGTHARAACEGSGLAKAAEEDKGCVRFTHLLSIETELNIAHSSVDMGPSREMPDSNPRPPPRFREAAAPPSSPRRSTMRAAHLASYDTPSNSLGGLDRTIPGVGNTPLLPLLAGPPPTTAVPVTHPPKLGPSDSLRNSSKSSCAEPNMGGAVEAQTCGDDIQARLLADRVRGVPSRERRNADVLGREAQTLRRGDGTALSNVRACVSHRSPPQPTAGGLAVLLRTIAANRCTWPTLPSDKGGRRGPRERAPLEREA